MSNEKGNRCRLNFVCGGVTQCEYAKEVGELKCVYQDGKECRSSRAVVDAIMESAKDELKLMKEWFEKTNAGEK